MRMRRKRNLDGRMNDCKEVLLEVVKDNLNAKTAASEQEHFDFEAIFGNKNIIYLEIGSGKGQFAMKMAKKHPEINIIAVEMLSNVLVDACEKTIDAGIKNLKYICLGAEYLPKYIAPNSIDKIFLNFSTPFPKSTYANSRLTHDKYIKIYASLLRDGGVIEQKTDSVVLFDYSLAQFGKYRFELSEVTRDLHKNCFDANIVTEYEEKFVSLGMPIHRLVAKFVQGVSCKTLD